MVCPKTKRSNSWLFGFQTEISVWNPNVLLGFQTIWSVRTLLQPNRQPVSEIRTCSDFGRLLYSECPKKTNNAEIRTKTSPLSSGSDLGQSGLWGYTPSCSGPNCLKSEPISLDFRHSGLFGPNCLKSERIACSIVFYKWSKDIKCSM